jgi:glycosyltransferase involved in cell wall biosynthesis
MSRLVLLARKLDQGGAERQIVTLAKALRERGSDVHVVLFYFGGVFDDELADAGVPTHFVGKRGRWDVVGFFARLIGILRNLRPTTIYSFLDLPNILAALIGLFVGRPRIVWSIRAAGMEMRHYDWISRLIPKLEAALVRLADVVVANSHAGKAWAAGRGFPADKIMVVENGIDTDRFQFDAAGRERVRAEWKVGNGEIAIGLVARLDVMKDHRNFLRACAILAKRWEDLRFVCVGGGASAYRAELDGFAVALGIANRLIWAGSRSDMPAVLSALDIASSSSFGEGFSNAIAESMACERPCVVTDVGDSARIVGEFGEVVPPRDPDAFASAMIRMLDRIDENAEIGSQARARIVNEFSVEHMVVRTNSILFKPR